MDKATRRGLTGNQLKIVAVIAMTFDHIMGGFVPHDTMAGLALRFPGCVAAPIMCYMVSEGWRYTSDRKRYFLRLLIFSALSHFPYNLYFGFSPFQATSVIWAQPWGMPLYPR